MYFAIVVVARVTADVILQEEMIKLGQQSNSTVSSYPLFVWCQQWWDKSFIYSDWVGAQLRVYGLGWIAYALALKKYFEGPGK